jgi:hypothetical protein
VLTVDEYLTSQVFQNRIAPIATNVNIKIFETLIISKSTQFSFASIAEELGIGLKWPRRTYFWAK